MLVMYGARSDIEPPLCQGLFCRAARVCRCETVSIGIYLFCFQIIPFSLTVVFVLPSLPGAARRILGLDFFFNFRFVFSSVRFQRTLPLVRIFTLGLLVDSFFLATTSVGTLGRPASRYGPRHRSRTSLPPSCFSCDVLCFSSTRG